MRNNFSGETIDAKKILARKCSRETTFSRKIFLARNSSPENVLLKKKKEKNKILVRVLSCEKTFSCKCMGNNSREKPFSQNVKPYPCEKKREREKRKKDHCDNQLAK